MKKAPSFYALCLAGIVTAAAAIPFAAKGADDYLPNFEDVPMMEKTFTIIDEGFVYSQPDGKIVQATVASDVVSRRQLQRFYRDALKELGWKKVADDRKMQIFHRGTDELRIEIVETDPILARFTLTPR